MWLLDANVDVHLVALLTEFGIQSETAASRGWKDLSNGELVAAAVAAGSAAGDEDSAQGAAELAAAGTGRGHPCHGCDDDA